MKDENREGEGRGGGHIIGGGLGLLIERTFVSRIVQKKKKGFLFPSTKINKTKSEKSCITFKLFSGRGRGGDEEGFNISGWVAIHKAKLCCVCNDNLLV